MRERDIEKYLVKRVKELGGEVRKVKWVGRDSAPDRVVMLPNQVASFTNKKDPTDRLILTTGRATLWVELKAPGGKATFPKNAHERKQHREHERMRRMGQRVEVIDSFEGVDELLS